MTVTRKFLLRASARLWPLAVTLLALATIAVPLANAAPASLDMARLLATDPPTPPTDTGSGPRVALLVKMKPGANINAAAQASGGDRGRSFNQTSTHEIFVPQNAATNMLAAWQKRDDVAHAEIARQRRAADAPNDPSYAQQWALPKIAWDQARDSVTISGSATIAVLDTGVDAAHLDLSGVMASGLSAFAGGNPSADPNGHGTAIAGIAAARVNNAVGIAGVAWTGASVAPVQVLGADGIGYDNDVVAGVLWAADNGADVIVMAFSSPDYSAALADALAYAWGRGVSLVAATGNNGSSAASYPAGMPNVLGVAATDQNDTVGANSNTGSALVAAPGVGILATQAGGAYGSITGTSAGAGHVAGVAALLGANGKTNAYVFDQVPGATDPVGGQTFGRVNVVKALGEAVAPPSAPSPAPTPGGEPVYEAGGNPDSTITPFPGTGSYTSATWDAGCTSPGICGTATGSGGHTVTSVGVSIRQNNGAGPADDLYWDGDSFDGTTETFFT